MVIQLLGFPTTLGLPREAAGHAPEKLRASGLTRQLERLGHRVVDHGDMALVPGLAADDVQTRLQKVTEAARAQKEHWLKTHRTGELMLTLGGDHSTSLGTIWALAEMGQEFDVVWVDAHGDFNVVETSPSGNPHGMVLAMAAGLMGRWTPKMISPDRLHLWGIRDLDAGEQQLLVQERVEVLSPDQVRAEWDRLVSRLGPNVLLSFDIDSVDPTDAPGTMTPVPGGFRRQEALDLVAAIARERNLLAVDLVEYHPDRDRLDRTAVLGLDVIHAAVTGQSLRHASELESAAGV